MSHNASYSIGKNKEGSGDAAVETWVGAVRVSRCPQRSPRGGGDPELSGCLSLRLGRRGQEKDAWWGYLWGEQRGRDTGRLEWGGARLGLLYLFQRC